MQAQSGVSVRFETIPNTRKENIMTARVALVTGGIGGIGTATFGAIVLWALLRRGGGEQGRPTPPPASPA